MPTQPAVTYKETDVIVTGPEFKLSYGTRTADGTDQAAMTNFGALGKKIKTNIFTEKYGKIMGGARANLGIFAAGLEPFFEGTLLGGSPAAWLRAAGRPSSEDTVTGSGPYTHTIKISRASLGPLTGKQMLIDIPGPQGQPMLIQLYNAVATINGDFEFEMNQETPFEIPIRIEGLHDPGAKAAGADPIGRIIIAGQDV